MKKIGVLLSGCGVYDGVEIHEAVITLLALDRNGAETICMAPDTEQYHVVNHLNGETSDEKRNVLVESARIARGNIKDVKTVNASDIDGLIMPGGFGAAKNLSNFALKGKNADIHPDVAKIVRDMVDAGKPVGAICIAPAVLSKIVEEKNPEVTIGNHAAFKLEHGYKISDEFAQAACHGQGGSSRGVPTAPAAKYQYHGRQPTRRSQKHSSPLGFDSSHRQSPVGEWM